MAISLLVLTGGCRSGTDPGAALEGIVRDEPIQVGAVVAAEVDTDGVEREFTFRAEHGELLVVYFGYTRCPDLCPATLADLKGALARLDPSEAQRVSTAFVTVDPERDTPEVMVGYLDHFVDRGHAVRIVEPDTRRDVEAAFGASSSITTTPDGSVEVSHTSITYVVDPAGSVLVEWPFGVSSEAMAADLHRLLDRITEEPS